jgi:hypothetical protein
MFDIHTWMWQFVWDKFFMNLKYVIVNMKGEYDFDIWGFEKVCMSFVKLLLDRKCYCEGAKFVATCFQK